MLPAFYTYRVLNEKTLVVINIYSKWLQENGMRILDILLEISLHFSESKQANICYPETIHVQVPHIQPNPQTHTFFLLSSCSHTQPNPQTHTFFFFFPPVHILNLIHKPIPFFFFPLPPVLVSFSPFLVIAGPPLIF